MTSQAPAIDLAAELYQCVRDNCNGVIDAEIVQAGGDPHQPVRIRAVVEHYPDDASAPVVFVPVEITVVALARRAT